MTKFKFGDKVWHDDYGVGIILTYPQSTAFNGGPVVVCVSFDGNPLINAYIFENSLTKVSDWIPCSECMPEFGQSVTVYDGDRMWTDTTYDFGDGLCFYYDDDGRATHWMPLPAPPSEVEQ